nr:hypothetical protein [uncultured Prevotella sp.]
MAITAEFRKKMLENLKMHKLLNEKGFVCQGGAIFYGAEDFRMYVGKEKDYKQILSNIPEIKRKYQRDLEDLFQKPISKIRAPELVALCPQQTRSVELSLNF